MEFYRYEAVQYAVVGMDGEFESSPFCNPKLEIRTFVLFKETPKGYWITYDWDRETGKSKRWVSKTSKKRFAYPTKAGALNNYILRTTRRIEILESQIEFSKASLRVAISKQGDGEK